MKKISRAVSCWILLLVSSFLQAQQNTQLNSLNEEQAYTLGVQAYIFCYPWSLLSKIQYSWVSAKQVVLPGTPNMSMNQFWHNNKNITDAYRDGGTPNNDTYYSVAWLDVSKEPIILSHGDMGDQYFTFEIASFNSDNFAYVGARTTGSKAGKFAIVGRNWKGTLPAGVKKLPASPTDNVLIFGRTAVKGEADGPSAIKKQATYQLTPLSQIGNPNYVVPENHDVLVPYNPKTDPLADWKTINRAMIKNPALQQHAVLLDMFKTIGIGPGIDIDKLDQATKKGLARASIDGMKMLQAISITGDDYPKVNGWSIPPKTMGRAMINNDFNTIALQCLGGIISHDPEEAIYLNTHADVNGTVLNGANKYTIHFEPNQLPDVKYFWSLTMYDTTNNLVHNPINRWSIGSLASKFKLANDGSLTLYIQKDSPGADKEDNWLPSPAEDFWVVFRLYGPSKKIIDQTWKMPPLKKE